MSIVPRIQLKTPWAIPDKRIGSNIHYWKKAGYEHILEWALGDSFETMSFEEARRLIKAHIGVIIIPFESMHLCDKVKIEWERSGKIIPGKRMVLTEKRKQNNENT